MAFAALLFVSTVWKVSAQQPGTLKKEGNPTIELRECTIAGGCSSKEAKLVLDANWRWIHTVEGYQNCYTGNKFDAKICADPASCAESCAVEGVDKEGYENNYGITAVPGGVKLAFMKGNNVGSRLFLLDDDAESYKLFKLKNREFALDVDVSHVECGMNGAMYFIEMDGKGGKGLGQNNAGAAYGTGYCDAQCPHDIKFVNGLANADWKANGKDFSGNSGKGRFGACCAELDIWEANKISNAYTPHPCNIETSGQYACDGTECGDNDKDERYDGVCDKDGCDINPFRNGNTTFYGPGPDFVINTLEPMTVVTQFLTTDGTDDGELSEMRRFYIQNGKTIHSPSIKILPSEPDSITDQSCSAMKDLFSNPNDFKAKGGMAQMGHSLDRGHVAAFSLWDDTDVHMMWLDSSYPTDRPVTDPGVKRGSCKGGEESSPRNVRRKYGSTGYVTFANVAIGEIGSTQGNSVAATTTKSSQTTPQTTSRTTEAPRTTTPSMTPSTTSDPSCSALWQQCGGKNHNGPTCCEAGSTCVLQNEWYSQCKPASDASLSQEDGVSAKKRTSRPHHFLAPSFMQRFVTLDKSGSGTPIQQEL